MEKGLTRVTGRSIMDPALEGMMKKLLFMIFLLIIPQTSYSQEIVWGTSLFEDIGIQCSVPQNKIKPQVEKEILDFKRNYNPVELKKRLNRIVVCGELSRAGYKWFRGTYVDAHKSIFVEVGKGEHNDIEYVLHHEFSSLVWLEKVNPKIIREWKTNSNFSYNLDENISSDWTVNEQEQKKGALYRYCKTTVENDFNVIAAFYMSDYLKPLLKKAMARHVRIKNKVRIFEKLYDGLLRNRL